MVLCLQSFCHVSGNNQVALHAEPNVIRFHICLLRHFVMYRIDLFSMSGWYWFSLASLVHFAYLDNAIRQWDLGMTVGIVSAFKLLCETSRHFSKTSLFILYPTFFLS